MLKTFICRALKSYNSQLANQSETKEIYAYETKLIIDHLGSMNREDRIQELENFKEIHDKESDTIRKMASTHTKIVELVHILRTHHLEDE